MATAIDIARASIKHYEGLRLRPYFDTKGKLTVGYGHNMDDSGEPVTICHGLVDKHRAEELLTIGMVIATKNALKFLPKLGELDKLRQSVVVEMAYNMGLGNAKEGLSSFALLKQALSKKDYVTAAMEMLASKWKLDVGRRAINLAYRMENGILEDELKGVIYP